MPESWSNALPRGAVSTQWDDLRCPVNVLAPGATPPDPIIYGPGGSVRIRGFNGTGAPNVEALDFTAQLPHSYKEGSNIYPHVHWCPTTANAGTVIWYLDYYWQDIGDVIPALTTINTGAIASPGAAWQHLQAGFPIIAGVGFRISSMLMCRVYRDNSTDTYPDDAGLLEVDFHFEQDSVGSRTEGHGK